METSGKPLKPLRRKLLMALALIATVTCLIAGWVCFSLSSQYIRDRIVSDEARFMVERGRAANRDFDYISEAHGAADRMFRSLLEVLDDDEVDRIFEAAFEPRDDGTWRLTDAFYDGTVLDRRAYHSFAAFVSPGEITPARKRAIVAGLEAIRSVTVPFEGKLASLALALPSDDMIIFAPDRPDDLTYYRHDAPADFAVWKHIIAERGESTQCTGPVQVGWDPTGRSLAAGCQTMIEQEGAPVGAWDSTLPLNRRLVSLVETDDETERSIVATAEGSVIIAPELGFSATASAEEIDAVTKAYSVDRLVEEIDAQGRSAGAFLASDGRWVVRYNRFSGPDWVLIDLISWHSLMMETMRAPLLVTVFLLISLIAQAALVGAFVQRRFVLPLKVLTEVFGRSRAEQSLEDSRLSQVLSQDDEIGILASRLYESRRDHEDIIDTLEQRVTERTAEYERASRAKSEFLANMSHEIRTPMNGVLGMAELLSLTELDEKQEVYADTIHSSASALLTILNDILDFSKIEAGRLELDLHAFDFHQAVDDIAMLLGPSAREKGLELAIRYDPNMPEKVVGDAGRLRQVLTNLVGNALKFTHEGYVLVDVSGHADENRAHFRVEVVDTGIGVPEEKIDLIFEQFTQSDGATTRQYGGTGLGLAISRSLIEAMGGTIGVTSEPGRGSTFWFDIALPLSPEATVRGEDAPALDIGRVLIVDDMPVNRQILLEQITAWGLEAEAVSDVDSALERLTALQEAGEPLPLVLLDYQMPHKDGIDFAEELRRSPAAAAPIIVLSSVSNDAVAQAFRKLGVIDVLTKPVPSHTLRSVLERACRANVDARAKTKNVKEKSRGGEKASGQKPRILVADDNLTNRMVVEHMLGTSLFHLCFAQNGQEALDMFTVESFDLVLMDVSMPVMDGIEATKAIRAFEKREGRPGTPIVALTAHAMPDDKERFLRSGMDDYLAKPLSKDLLDRLIERRLGVASGRPEARKAG